MRVGSRIRAGCLALLVVVFARPLASSALPTVLKKRIMVRRSRMAWVDVLAAMVIRAGRHAKPTNARGGNWFQLRQAEISSRRHSHSAPPRCPPFEY
jgi:hypothetical protein